MINRFEHLVTFYKNLVVSILWIAFISGSYGSLTVLPKNTAVVTGSQVRFLCTSSLPYPTWSWRSSNIPQPLVSGSCTLAITANSQIFGVDSTPPGSCNLIINSTSSENGAYTCGDADQIAPNTGIAVLTVLDSGPICIMNATNSTVFNSSSNILQMECHVSYSTYYNYSIEPRLAWSRTSPPPSYPNSTFAFSVLSTRLAIPETSSETCTLGFVPSTNPPPNHNTDAPSFTSNCNTPVIYPLYCPMNVTITGASDDGSIDNGAQLHCSASANPSASYQWYFITSTSVGVVINETISVTATGNYTCKATNIINGGNCTAYTIQEITIRPNITHFCELFNCGDCDPVDYDCCIWGTVFLSLFVIVVGILILLEIYLIVRAPGVSDLTTSSACPTCSKFVKSATWWCYEPYSRCRCWGEVCCCKKNPTD